MGAAVAGAPALISGTAQAQAWPSKPIRLVVSAPAGGLTDALARAYGDYISQKVGQPVVVENKAGASGIIAAEMVAKSPADGYTLLFSITSFMVLTRVLFKSLPFDPDKDFVYIAFMDGGHLPFLVHKSVPATNIKEFVAWARNNKVSVGSYSQGSYAHMLVAELNKAFGLSMEPVHYRGEAPMWQDFSAGALHAGTGSYQACASILASGTGRAIAVPQTTRMKKLPDVPTFLEQGVTAKLFQIRGWAGLLAPAGVPGEIVERLSALAVEAGQSARMRQMLETFGIDGAASGHKAFAQLLKDENPVWIDVLKQLALAPQ